MIQKLLWFCLVCFMACGCNSLKKHVKCNETNSIEVVKFMYLNEYPIAIYEKSFWANRKEEHASFNIEFTGKTFLDEVESLSTTDCSKFDFYNYAFIVKKVGHDNDTIYADTSLRTWIFKHNGKTECRYDEKGFYTEFLRQQYPFFSDCW